MVKAILGKYKPHTYQWPISSLQFLVYQSGEQGVLALLCLLYSVKIYLSVKTNDSPGYTFPCSLSAPKISSLILLSKLSRWEIIYLASKPILENKNLYSPIRMYTIYAFKISSSPHTHFLFWRSSQWVSN